MIMITLVVGNAKGGTGKTTASVHLAASLPGSRLLVDFDPQGSATQWVTGNIGDGGEWVAALESDTLPEPVETGLGFDIVRSGPILGGRGLSILRADERGPVSLKIAVGKAVGYDWAVIDSPPSVTHLVSNAINAANAVVIPCECSLGALEGLAQYLNLLDKMESVNPCAGNIFVIPSRYDRRTRHANKALEALRAKFGPRCLQPVPETVQYRDAWAARGVVATEKGGAFSLAAMAIAGEVNGG